jgi:hypothetical protein
MADEETQAANDAIRAEVAAAKGKQDDDGSNAATGTGTPTREPADPQGNDVPLGEAGEKALEAFKQRARDAEKEARALAAKVKEYEDRDKSEQEKLEERATTAEQRAAAAERQLLRFEVATAKSLPPALADRLQGDTKKALEEDADRLLELVKPSGKPTGDIDAGRGEGGGDASMNDLMRAAAGHR